MITAMLAAQRLGATGAKVLNYANSGDVMGDRGQVVGYMAAAVFAPEKRVTKDEGAVSSKVIRHTTRATHRGSELSIWAERIDGGERGGRTSGYWQ